jgi:hypothetical protein
MEQVQHSNVRPLDFGSDPAEQKGTPGRVDGGQEQAIQIGKISDKLDHLLKLHRKCEEAKENLSDAIKAVAESGGIHASVLKRFVAARGGDGFTKAKIKSEQLQLLFDEIGE